MRRFIINYTRACYDDRVWFIVKLLLTLSWLVSVKISIDNSTSVLIPDGICMFFNCNFFQSSLAKDALWVLSSVLSFFYVFEVRQKYVLLLLFCVSVITFSLSDSSGVLNRMQGFSMCYFTQLLAYVDWPNSRASKPLNKRRIDNSIQVLAAIYTLAGISKLGAEGIDWFIKYEGLAVQVYKSWMYNYATTGEESIRQLAESRFYFIIEHPGLITSGLALALLLETFAGFALISRKWSLTWGLLLFCMHAFIQWSMDIVIVAIVIPMILFFINPAALALSACWTFSDSRISGTQTQEFR